MLSQVRIVNGAAAKQGTSQSGWRALYKSDTLLVEANGPVLEWRAADGTQRFVAGTIEGFRRGDGSLADASTWPLEATRFQTARGTDSVEGRFVLVSVAADGRCEVRSDRFGICDIYYQSTGDGQYFATEQGLLPFATRGVAPNAIGYAHAVTVYGARPAKMDTLYAGVQRLGVGQTAKLATGKLQIENRPFVAAESVEYGERDHHEYADALLEAIRARASINGNVVYLSSGWDSTSILGCLVHLFGPRKTRAVIGRMRYAERSGICNQFEIDRAKAVADFYGVKLDICELDYRTTAPDTVNGVLPIYRAHGFASATGLNHWRLADHVAKTSGGDEVVFAGEISDGAHNLGFSQFVTIFHPVMEFREYSDKMASYLFGPTFLSQMLAGTHEQDPIWNLFRQRAGATMFDAPAADSNARTLQMLSSFFLRGTRMPLCSLSNTRFLSERGRAAYLESMEPRYLADAASAATPQTLYSWYLHLYNSFHWQGSTVATLPHTAAAHGLRCALPFYDGRVQDFLSAMPESWGRGLDMRPTKFPLKWTLQNRIRYPMHLQVGPHSYTYDVDPTFSHAAELMFASSLGTLFKERLKTRAYQGWFAQDTFDVAYIDRIVTRYLGGEEFRGAEMNDVFLLGLLALPGRLGEG